MTILHITSRARRYTRRNKVISFSVLVNASAYLLKQCHKYVNIQDTIYLKYKYNNVTPD